MVRGYRKCDNMIMNIWIETDENSVDEIVTTLDTLYKIGLIKTWQFDVKEKNK